MNGLHNLWSSLDSCVTASVFVPVNLWTCSLSSPGCYVSLVPTYLLHFRASERLSRLTVTPLLLTGVVGLWAPLWHRLLLHHGNGPTRTCRAWNAVADKPTVDLSTACSVDIGQHYLIVSRRHIQLLYVQQLDSHLDHRCWHGRSILPALGVSQATAVHRKIYLCVVTSTDKCEG